MALECTKTASRFRRMDFWALRCTAELNGIATLQSINEKITAMEFVCKLINFIFK